MPLTHGRTAAGDQKPAAEKKKEEIHRRHGRRQDEGDVSKPGEKQRETEGTRERADKEGMTLVKVERVKDGRARVHDINERVTGRGVSVYLLSSRRKSKGFIL